MINYEKVQQKQHNFQPQVQETTYESDGHATSVITATETKSVETGNIRTFNANTANTHSKLNSGLLSPSNSQLNCILQKRKPTTPYYRRLNEDIGVSLYRDHLNR